jgi:uncharacterized protein (TIGR03437 family)
LSDLNTKEEDEAMMQFSKTIPLAMLAVSLMAAATASAQTISILSGDGQVAAQNFAAQAPMVVVVKNLQGQPQAGVTVTWTITSGGGSLLSGSTTVTDSNGQASNSFLGNTLFNVNFAQSIITASIPTGSVNFTETTSGSDPTAANAPFVKADVIFPTLSDVLTGAAGSTGTMAVQVKVAAVGPAGSGGVPNVLIKLVPADPNGPQIACAGNTGYTDINGNANCLPLFSGPTASGRYSIDVGGAYRTFGPYQFTVTQGQFSVFRILSGNNQSGNPGTTITLTARAEDAAGNPQANVPVVWEAVTPGSVTISNASSSSDASGNVTATVTLNTPGTVQVRLRNTTGSVQSLFTLQVTQILSGLSKSTGDSQTAITNATFAQPLVVTATSSQGPASGVQVRFTASGGIILPNNGIATTDSQGRASITAQAGSTPGTFTVTASVSQFTVSFTLTVRLPGPQITSSSFFNAAGGQAGGVSPTAIAAVYGTGIATGIQGCVSGSQFVGPLPLQVSLVNVQFISGTFTQYAPVFAVCNLGPGQEYVVIQVPADVPLGATSVKVTVGSGSTTLDNIPVTPVSPGVFETQMSDGKKRAVLIRVADGSYITLENPAHPSDRLKAFVTGLGRPVSKTGVRLGSNQGGIPGDDASPQVGILVGVADQGVNFVSANYAQDIIGVYEVTFDVPANAPTGNDVNFVVAAILNDNPVFSNGSKLPIQ